MNIDDVRAWWEENLEPLEGTVNVREIVVQKIISTYAAGIFTGTRAERRRLRDRAAEHEKARFEASPADVMFPQEYVEKNRRLPPAESHPLQPNVLGDDW